jgi:hypothetical protein
MFRTTRSALTSLACQSVRTSRPVLAAHVRAISLLSSSNCLQFGAAPKPTLAGHRFLSGSAKSAKKVALPGVVEEGDQVTAHMYIKVVSKGEVVVDTGGRDAEQPTTFMAGMGEVSVVLLGDS